MTAPNATYKATVLYGGKNLTLEQFPIPALRLHEGLITPGTTGICGANQDYYRNGCNDIDNVEEPWYLAMVLPDKLPSDPDVTTVKVGFCVPV